MMSHSSTSLPPWMRLEKMRLIDLLWYLLWSKDRHGFKNSMPISTQCEPTWLDVNAMQGNVARLLQRSNEEPIILANSRATPLERLYDPTQLQGSWAAQLVRPKNRDDLFTMSGGSHLLTQSVVLLLTCVFSPRLHHNGHRIRIATSSTHHGSLRTSPSDCKEDWCQHPLDLSTRFSPLNDLIYPKFLL